MLGTLCVCLDRGTYFNRHTRAVEGRIRTGWHRRQWQTRLWRV